jgi:hypothetical protein
MKRTLFLLIVLGLCFSVLFTACTPEPPKDQSNVCLIFKQYPKWYWATQDTQKRWGVPISVQMAIIHQESHFRGDAKPPRKKLLWVIPWKRPSSAKGYSQAVDSTWAAYQRDTGKGGHRSSFDAATDFLGWYCYRAHKKLGIARTNAYALYLAYHEGMGGYSRRSYNKKPWLLAVAKKVQAQANAYHYQLVRCQAQLPKKSWWRIW